LLKLSPTISDPHEVGAQHPNRPSDSDLGALEPIAQASQSSHSAARYPRPMNPEDNRRLSVYSHVELERTADVCPPGPARDAVDQGRDGRIIWAGSRSEPARQGRGRGRSLIPFMAMAQQRTPGRVRPRAWRNLAAKAAPRQHFQLA